MRDYRVHPDTYLTHLSGFLTYDGVTMPQYVEWDDDSTPRTAHPVRFRFRIPEGVVIRSVEDLAIVRGPVIH